MRSASRFVLAACALVVLGSCAAKREAPAAYPARGESAESADVAKEAASYAAPSPADGGGGGESQPQAASGLALPVTRMVIKTATLSVKVKDVQAAFTRAVELAEQKGGYVQSSSQSSEYGLSAELSLRIPPEGFLPLVSSLEELGESMRKGISGQDVTEEYYDLKAELENEEQVRQRLFELLKRASTVPEAIAVEAELERVGATVNRILGRMKYLQTMVGMSSVDLTLYEEASYTPVRETFINWSEVGAGFWTAARVLVQGFFVLLQSLVVIVPLGGIVAAGVLLVRRVVRRRGGAKAKRSS